MRTTAPGRPLVRGEPTLQAHVAEGRDGQWHCVPSQRPPALRVPTLGCCLTTCPSKHHPKSTEELAQTQSWLGPWGARFARSGRDPGI